MLRGVLRAAQRASLRAARIKDRACEQGRRKGSISRPRDEKKITKKKGQIKRDIKKGTNKKGQIKRDIKKGFLIKFF